MLQHDRSKKQTNNRVEGVMAAWAQAQNQKNSQTDGKEEISFNFRKEPSPDFGAILKARMQTQTVQQQPQPNPMTFFAAGAAVLTVGVCLGAAMTSTPCNIL